MILRFAVVVQWVDKKYSIPMSDVLGAIRVKIFETLSTKDAIRFKKAQVRLDNITSETFESIVKKLSTLAKSEGEWGSSCGGMPTRPHSRTVSDSARP